MINLHSPSASASASASSTAAAAAPPSPDPSVSSHHHHLLPTFHHLPLLPPHHHHHHHLLPSSHFPIPTHPPDSEMMPPAPSILGRTPIIGAMEYGNNSSCNGYTGGRSAVERHHEVGGSSGCHLAAAARSSTPASTATEHHLGRGYGYNSNDGRSAEREAGGGDLSMQQGYGGATAAAGGTNGGGSESHSHSQSQNNVMDDAGSGRAANDGNRSTSYGGGGGGGGSSRYESQKRRDWNTFGQYLKNQQPPLPLAVCSGAHVLNFLRYLDQFGKTKVHTASCPYFGRPQPPAPCGCPLRQAWGSLDALIGRLRAAFEEHGGRPEANPFGARAVRLYLREVKETQAKARGIAYEKKKRRGAAAAAAASQRSAGGGSVRAPTPPLAAGGGSAHMTPIEARQQAAAQPRFLEH